MGREATATKRRVLDKTLECIERTNQCLTDVQGVAAQHNGLAQQVDADLSELKIRFKAVSSWCDDNERAGKQHAALVHRFHRMTFHQRLSWLLFGALPESAHVVEDAFREAAARSADKHMGEGSRP